MSNLDARTVSGFGAEWSQFDQTGVAADELERFFGMYFEQFPWAEHPANAVGFDVGCGSGRWARFVAPRVGQLHCGGRFTTVGKFAAGWPARPPRAP